jgi:hypothetical protein
MIVTRADQGSGWLRRRSSVQRDAVVGLVDAFRREGVLFGGYEK